METKTSDSGKEKMKYGEESFCGNFDKVIPLTLFEFSHSNFKLAFPFLRVNFIKRKKFLH